jgi:phenylpropionate dioxygenase-like ring-hydroxylating dioxygenase large terminal subunit
MQLDDILRRLGELASTPLEQATAMPPAAYHSEQQHALEKERIFAREWLCVGRANDIPNTGDYLTFSIADQPVFAIRGKDGAIRSFSNVCLHRMMRLLDGTGSCRRIVCPYHAWTYSLDGRLIGAAHMKRSPGFDTADHGLPAIRTEIWQGWIYVTLNEAAKPVAELLAALEPAVARYRMADYVPIAMQDHVWNTNWKLLTENFMEGYHLPVAHRETVGAWFPANDTEFPAERNDAFTFQTFIKSSDATYGLAHADNKVLQGRERCTTVMPTIFPSHMYILAPDHLWYLSLRPRGTGQVQVRFGVALAPEVHAALDNVEKFTADLLGFFDKVNAEDRYVVEGLYQGTGAPLAKPGRISWLEREIHDFISYLASRLGDAVPTKQTIRRVS